MKISSLYIDGFGKFHNWKPSVSFGEGLTAIVGPNEAGKTTLLAFIRRMLYGFPDGRKKDLNHYAPINGGTIGGRLEIQGEDDQEYILSRTGIRGSPSLTYADGTTARGSTLSSLLGPCDQVFYENVCAIGLGELQEISTLRKDEIRDRLAAAGAGNLPVRDVATFLQTSADEIYAVRGKKKRINILVSDLKEIEAKIRDVKKRQGDYDQINEEIVRVRKTVAEEERKQKTVEEKIAYFKALGQAWEAFTERDNARNTLSTIQEIEPFPGEALEKLNRTEEEVQRLKKEHDDLTEEHTRLKEEIERCVVRGEVLEQADTIHALERKTEWYRSQVNDLKGCQQESEPLEAELASILKSLGGDWDAERVTRFDTSFPVMDDTTQLRERLTKTANACSVQQSQLGTVEKEAEEKKGRLNILQKRRNEIGDVARPDAAREKLGRSRELSSEMKYVQELENRLFSIRQEEARTAENKKSLNLPQAYPSWPGILLAFSAILVFAWGYLAEALLSAGIVALILLIAAASIFLAGKNRGEEKGTPAVTPQYEKEGETLASQRREIESERLEREEKIRSCAASLGFNAPPSRTVAEDLEHTLQDAVREADKAFELDKDIDDAKELCRTAEASLKKAQENLQHASSERKGAQDAWRQWCQERDLPETMNPDLIPDLIANIRRAADHYTQITAMKKREEDLSKDIYSFKGDIITVRDACGESLKGPHDTILEGLSRMLHDEEEAKRNYNNLNEKLKEKSEKLEWTSAQNNKAKTNLENILKERGAKTPEEYRAFEQLSRKRQELEQNVQGAESAIRRISGEEHYNDFITALHEYDPVQMQVDLQEKEGDYQRCHDTIEEKNQAIGKLIEQRSGIEGDHELTRLLSREAELKEDIKQMSRQWAVYTVASGLLGMAVETFERDRQPEILREAQSFFTGITDGRYTRVVKPFDGSDPYVEEATGVQKRIDELSRGTAEQLYLALRFGYIRDYANSSLPVPVIFDDILVNFDPMRRKNACQAIADLAGTCQVLYFTCHPETVSDLTEVVPDAVVMDISKT